MSMGKKKSKYPLMYHITPPTGLINDPNGLVQFKGEFHVFFQWNPYGTSHENKCWGHVSSKDLIHWKRHEAALVPSEYYDKDGIYSGSAIVKDNQLYVFYTGNVIENGNNKHSYQCLAVSDDGYNFEKLGPIISHPEGYSRHVRDPKVWKSADNTYRMILGAQKENLTGDVLLYYSDDLKNWIYKGSIFKKMPINMGYMFECPDLLTFSESDVLILSSQGLEEEINRFENIYQTGYYLGKFKQNKFEIQSDFIEMDRGFEFYAPQNFSVGNRILMFGWMGCMHPEEEAAFPTISEGWVHCLTIPRELKLVNRKLIQTPIKELENLRDTLNSIQFSVTNLSQQEIELENPCANIILNFDNLIEKFTFSILNAFSLCYCREERTISIERENWHTKKIEHRISVIDKSINNIEIFLDGSSIELFVNNGELVMSSRYISNNALNRKLFFEVQNGGVEGTLYPIDYKEIKI